MKCRNLGAVLSHFLLLVLKVSFFWGGRVDFVRSGCDFGAVLGLFGGSSVLSGAVCAQFLLLFCSQQHCMYFGGPVLPPFDASEGQLWGRCPQ